MDEQLIIIIHIVLQQKININIHIKLVILNYYRMNILEYSNVHRYVQYY